MRALPNTSGTGKDLRRYRSVFGPAGQERKVRNVARVDSYHIKRADVEEDVVFSGANTLVRHCLDSCGGSIVCFGVHHSSQEDMSQPVHAEAVEVVFGEIQPKSTSEILDSSFEFMSS